MWFWRMCGTGVSDWDFTLATCAAEEIMLNLAAGSLRFVKKPTPDPRDATIKKPPGWVRNVHAAYRLVFEDFSKPGCRETMPACAKE